MRIGSGVRGSVRIRLLGTAADGCEDGVGSAWVGVGVCAKSELQAVVRVNNNRKIVRRIISFSFYCKDLGNRFLGSGEASFAGEKGAIISSQSRRDFN